MSWAGLPGYDCGVCGAPSCSTAARLMEVGELDPTSCPFSEPRVGSPWVAQPSEVSVRRPCPSDRLLVQAIVSLVAGGARYRPLDADLAARLMAAAGAAAAPALRDQMASARWGAIRVQAFASGRLAVKLRGSDEEAVSALSRVARIILPALACQSSGLLEAEVAAGCAGGAESPCLPPHLAGILGLDRLGATVREILEEDETLAAAASSLSILDAERAAVALVEGVDRLSSGSPTGLWLIGVALEVERALKNDPRGEDLRILSGALSGRPIDGEGVLREARRRLERRDRSARVLLSAANVLASKAVVL